MVPAYNEAERLGPTLQVILDYLSREIAARRAAGAEIIVVDDGSADGTSAVAERCLAGGGLPYRVLVNPENRGKGHSVRRGLLAATGDLVLFSDADLSTPIEDLERLEAAIAAGADIAIGSTHFLDLGHNGRRMRTTYRNAKTRLLSRT